MGHVKFWLFSIKSLTFTSKLNDFIKMICVIYFMQLKSNTYYKNIFSTHFMFIWSVCVSVLRTITILKYNGLFLSCLTPIYRISHVSIIRKLCHFSVYWNTIPYPRVNDVTFKSTNLITYHYYIDTMTTCQYLIRSYVHIVIS